ncbi:MAG: sulfatase [Phycisphaerae bacterium]|nr:sulfatase [Phycisphaerae bacterium]
MSSSSFGRIPWVALVAVLVASAGFSEEWACAQTTQAASSQPNIVFLLTDDMRWDAMGCAGMANLRTPNLDRLAGEGVRFANMFCTTSICAVSRASFLTGQWASRHGVQDFATPLSAEAFAETFPALLRRGGYRTAFVGKWGLGDPLPTKEFDYWDGFPGQGKYFEKEGAEHLTRIIERKALEFVKTCEADRPFLLCLSTKAPHVQDSHPKQFLPDPMYDALYADVTFPPPVTANEQAFKALPDFVQNSEGRTRWQRRFATPEQYQESVRNYHRLIAGVDRLVGRLREALDAAGLADNTVILFTSDNGFFLGEHGLAGKWLMHEESIRLPLIVCDPRVSRPRRGRVEARMVLVPDVAPTICELAGVMVPIRMQGKSLVPLVAGRDIPWRGEWFYEHHYSHGGRIPQTEGVRTERWKYIRYIEHDPPVEELYDLVNDSVEQRNFAENPEHASTLEQLRERWRVLKAEAR